MTRLLVPSEHVLIPHASLPFPSLDAVTLLAIGLRETEMATAICRVAGHSKRSM